MKPLIIGILTVSSVATVITLEVADDPFKGYSKMISRAIHGDARDNKKRAHNLDLSKYRPNIRKR